MAANRYWQGFATGAMIGAAASSSVLLFGNLWGRAGHSRIIRLEKSIQVGRAVEEVFEAWQQLDQLPQLSHTIQSVTRHGNRSRWRVNVNGRTLEWVAVIEQLIPNQAIGWKSVAGVKHTGRINFSPLEHDTMVHVTMNYAPPARLLRPFMAPMSGQLEGYIEQVLRDFKRAVESGETSQAGPRAYSGRKTTDQARATGTFGPNPTQTSRPQNPRFDSTANPVGYTAPPDAKR